MITAPDRIRAFLDDIALISAKHGLAFMPTSDGSTIAIDVSRDESFSGYYGSFDQASDWWLVSSMDGCEVCRLAQKDVVSLDVSSITAHQRITLAKSLRDTAASLPIGPDIQSERQE